jgi:predicted secreted hydrolase
MRLTRRELFAVPVIYRKALPGYRYSFPRDHFEHPDFRTEWWYYTGNLSTAQGRPFGFELTFFRQGADGRADNDSVWAVRDVYLAHLALSDISSKRFHHRERLNRQGPGIAGASFEKRSIWNGNWRVLWQGDIQNLEATADDFSLRLSLRSAKQPVIHGRDGISQKSAGQGKASHYVSLTRLLTDGEVTVGGIRNRVTGTSWMDHEFFTNQLSEDQSGWDWFSIQLENGADLMLYRLRRKDSSIEPLSHGTYIDNKGFSRELSLSDFRMTPGRRRYNSYPIEWTIEVPTLDIALEATTPMENQELVSTNRISPSYWEGAIQLKGRPSNGVGYLEMTGYREAVSF